MMRFNFAIIGGGLTATAMLCQLVDRVQAKAVTGQLDSSKIGIHIYEKQDVFGPGFPHSNRFALPFHITNMCASDMGILYGKPDDFQDWVTGNFDDLLNRFSWFHQFSSQSNDSPDNCNHYPRAIMGEYLKTKFQEAVESAREVGLDVNLYPRSEVVNLKQNGAKIILSIRDLRSKHQFANDADRVLLATGHWFEKNDQDHFFTSPWPATRLRRSIPQGAKVAVIGTSLSAIETLLTLTSDGGFVRSDSGQLSYTPSDNPRRFVLYSRRGLLPKVRGKMGTHKNRFLNRENLDRLLSQNRGNLTLEPIFKLLNSELESAYSQPLDWEAVINPVGKPADLLQGYLDDAVNGDGPDGELIWQTILHQSFAIVRDVYLNLTLAERRRFDKNYTSVFFTHAATQPAINAEKLLALMKAGMVEVFKLGNDYRLVKNVANADYEFIYTDDCGNPKRDAYRYVVDARGQKKSMETNHSELAKTLINSGIVQLEEFRPTGSTVPMRENIVSESETASKTYKTGSVWIDPETYKIMQRVSDKKITQSSTIYAVGAMIRGQIIEASMARGIVQATSRIADDMVNYLTRIFKN